MSPPGHVELRGAEAGPGDPALARAFKDLEDRMRALYVPASLGAPRCEGWVPARDMVEDPRAFVRERMREAGADPDFAKRDFAMDLVADVPWVAWGAPILFYATVRPVPDLTPDNLLLRYEAGYLQEVSFRTGRFAALTGGPHAGAAMEVFAGRGEMLGWMRKSLERLLRPLVAEVRAATRVGERTLWGRASDLAAQRFLWTGELCGDWPLLGGDAGAFVKAPGTPLDRNNAFFEVEHAGRRGVFMRRSVCCQEYRAAGGNHCEQCPVLSPAERERRAREVLAGVKGPGRWD